MDTYELTYQSALSQIESLITSAIDEKAEYGDINSFNIEETVSDLDGWDYCCAIIFGVAGLLLSTSSKLAEYMEDVHKAASGASGDYDGFQKMLGKLLNHKDHPIDQIDGGFINRGYENAYPVFHRLLWGHDVLSIREDNPFYLMVKKQGIGGILQVVRHLLADTLSRQGLPFPGSSFLDYTDSGKGNHSNYLIDIVKKLSKGADTKIQGEKIYSHMFTVRGQDVVAGTVVKLFSDAYFKGRGIKDNIRISQFMLIAYSVNFFGEAIYGCTKQGGVPYINLPLGVVLTKTFGKFCLANYRDINKMQAVTDELIKKDDELMASSHRLTQLLPSYESADGYCIELLNGQKNVDEIFNFFGEG